MPKPPRKPAPRAGTERPARPAKPSRQPADKAPAGGASATPAGSERIAKVLARAGIASRREAEAMILAGRVAVNGVQIETPALNTAPQDRITVDGQPLRAAEPPRLWLYHKPAGLVTTARDEKGRATVFDDLPADMPRVMSVGRLDLNSEGLLLLTNDGEIKRRLELPTTGWLRKYRVRVKGTPDNATFEPLRKGIVIEGERFAPMIVSLDRQQGANAWITIGLREGRNREIRRAMEALGLQVNRLIRISFGPFQLGDLAPGAVEELRARVLRDQLGLTTGDEGADSANGQARTKPGKPAQPGARAGTRPGPVKTSAPKAAAPKAGPAQNRPGKATDEEAKSRPRAWGSRSHGTGKPAGKRDDKHADAATAADRAPGSAPRQPRSWGTKSARATVPGGTRPGNAPKGPKGKPR
ncbi:MAG: pseudouridine synthase [Pararhodobacter sp.]